MKKLDFNRGWTCRPLSRAGEPYPVTLPHDAMRGEARTNDSAGENNTGWYAGGDYEYTKRIAAPEDWRGKALLLEFEGVYRNAEIWLNGEKIHFRPYGYTNFYVDLSPHLRYGEDNELRVVARNADQPNSRWYSGTGIYRPVWLWQAGADHIPVNGLRVRTLDCTGEIEVTVRTTRPGQVSVDIFEAGGTAPVASAAGASRDGQAVFTIVLPDVKLWDCDCPSLYRCRARFEGDEAETTFGVRALAWGEDGLTLNGKRVILRGACIHHDNGLLGACSFPEAEERRVRILKENGYNALRSAHYPCSKALLDACDRLGMLLVDEYVDHWYIHKTKYDYVEHFMDWWRQDLRDMADKDFNHPCVIMYSTGNEVSETAQPKGIALTGELTRCLHEADGTRPVTCGINIFFNFLSSMGMGVYSDDKAEKAAAQAEKPKSRKKPVGSAFYNTLACLVGDWFMKTGATLPPCDWKTRDAFASMDIAGYNYGIFRYKKDLRKYPKRLILGSETFCKDAYRFWELAKQNPRIIGDFVWAGMDYIGETGEGCAEYADYKFDGEPCRRMTGGNGRIDLLGKPRAEAAYTRVALEREPGPYLAVTPVYQTVKLRLTGWQLTKALESWSWRGCAGMPAAVEVYARAYAVELFLNGTSVGKKRLKNTCRAVFRTSYQDGDLTAVSYDSAGREIGRYTLTTAGADTELRLTPEEESVKPEGLAFVRLQYTDAQGIWKPMEKHTLKVSVENGTLAGLGSANAYVEGNYTQDTTPTYYGEAMAVVRANGDGPVRVTVTDEAGAHTAVIPCEV